MVAGAQSMNQLVPFHSGQAAAAQRVDQLRQEAGGEGLRPCVQLDSRLHRHRSIVQRAAKRAIEVVGS